MFSTVTEQPHSVYVYQNWSRSTHSNRTSSKNFEL